MKPVYFLSDVHLGFATPDVEMRKQTQLVHLLRAIRDEAAHLYIVGDLFDFWFEYRSVIPRGYHAVLNALEEMRRRGVGIDYLAGNHDFAIGEFFSRDLDIPVWRDDLSAEWYGKSFYLHHGDGLAVNDAGYRALKKLLRSPVSQWFFRWLHPDIGASMARRISHSSRDYTAGKDYGEQDGMRRLAEEKIGAGYDYVVMGHRHLPVVEQIHDGTYVNLGDWISHFTFAVFDGTLMQLHSRKDAFRLEEAA